MLNKQHALKAFNLHMTHLAWKLHISQEGYDAWENNFKTNMRLETFMSRMSKFGTPENESSRAALFYGSKGITEDQYRNFIVVSFRDRHGGILVKRDEKVKSYIDWINRSQPRDFNASDLLMKHGIPSILTDVINKVLDPLEAAEIIERADAWEDLWSLKPASNFMFDIVWPNVHRYRQLYKEEHELQISRVRA